MNIAIPYSHTAGYPQHELIKDLLKMSVHSAEELENQDLAAKLRNQYFIMYYKD